MPRARFLAPVESGDTLTARSEVIGLKENSNGKTGIVWVRTTGFKGDVLARTGPQLCPLGHGAQARRQRTRARSGGAGPGRCCACRGPGGARGARLVSGYDFAAAGEPHRLGDYGPGEIIDHVDGVTLSEAEHMMATRLWQNTAKVHFDVTARPDGKRLIYGGHIISMARALSFNGLANAQLIAGINAGSHANPAFAGDTVRAWSEVLDTAETSAPGVGALRLRLVATKGGTPGQLRGEDGKYLPDILLDLDYWALMPV